MAAPSSVAPMFQHEVKCMMYAFGDCRSPSPDSTSLIEEITHKQVSELIVQTADVAAMRDGRSINIDDILFLLRKDKDKLCRMIRYLGFKSPRKGSSHEEEEVEEEDLVGFQPPSYKKQKYSLSFLTPVDLTGSDTPLINTEDVDLRYQEKLEHQDAITRSMDSQEYTEYYKKTAKFKEWLDIASLTDLKLSQDVVEVFGFLAYETVREIVELSLLVKKDMREMSSLDPCLAHTPAFPHSNPAHFGTTPTFSTTPASKDSGNASSPPPPPHPSPPHPPPLHPTQAAASISDSPSIPAAGIQPHHIREALRRHSSALTALSPLSTHFSRPTLYKKSLCL